VLSMEASMLLNLWDGLHPDGEEWRYQKDFDYLYWQHDRQLEEIAFANYIETWRERFPGGGYGRKHIPLFQLAAELVASRVFAPHTELGEAASWEAYETIWHPAGYSEKPENNEDEWVETLHGWEEVPSPPSPPPPGGMSALRILAAFGNGEFAFPTEAQHQKLYLPFSTSWLHQGFKFTGGRHELISNALIGGRDFGIRSTWIRHLVMKVDSFGPGPYYDSVESTPVLLFFAHLELADQLKRLWPLDSSKWPFTRSSDSIGTDPDWEPF